MSSPSSRQRAVALQYQKEKNAAPRVLASGCGPVAERIAKVAEACGIHLYQDRALAHALSKLDIGEEIPPELYRAVAEVLAFVYRMNERL